MEIKVLGMGCANCMKLHQNAVEAAQEVQGVTVTKIEDLEQIMKYGIMRTPALAINEIVKSQGRILSKQEIIKLLGTK